MGICMMPDFGTDLDESDFEEETVGMSLETYE
jgi:hypothetical protein